MTTTITTHAIETQLSATEDTIISTASNERKYIGKLVFTNTNTAAVTVTLWRLGSATAGTTGAGGNQFWVKTIPAGIAVECDLLNGCVLDNSEKISGKASVASVVNVNGWGTLEV